MPRLRSDKPVAMSGEIPAELLDVGSVAWESLDACLDWLDLHGLEPAQVARLSWGPLNRHRACVEAWSLVSGWSKPWCAANPRLVPDWARLRGAGVPTHGGALVVERFVAAGITFGG